MNADGAPDADPTDESLLVAAAFARLAGDNAAALALERCAGVRPVDPTVMTPGSLLDVARRGELDGIETLGPTDRVRLASYRVHRLGTDARPYGRHAAVILATKQTNEGDFVWFECLRRLEATHDWPFDRDAVRKALETAGVDAYGELHHHLGAACLARAVETRRDSFAVWMIDHFSEPLRAGQLIFAFDDAQGRKCTLLRSEGPTIDSSGSIKATFILSAGDDHVVEQEVYVARISASDFANSAPSKDAAALVSAATEAWCKRIEERARELSLDSTMPHDLVEGSPFAFVRLWLADGMPRARPVRVRWDDASLEKLLPSFRREHRVVEEEHLVDLFVGNFIVRLGVVVGESVRMAIARASDNPDFVDVTSMDQQSPPGLVFAPAGDAIAFRQLCAALTELVVRSGSDVEFAASDENEDDEDDDDAEEKEDTEDADDDEPSSPTGLLEALQFADALQAYGLGSPAIDWRLEIDFATEEAPDQIALRLREDPEGRADWERTASLYAAFIQQTFDPTFALPAIPW